MNDILQTIDAIEAAVTASDESAAAALARVPQWTRAGLDMEQAIRAAGAIHLFRAHLAGSVLAELSAARAILTSGASLPPLADPARAAEAGLAGAAATGASRSAAPRPSADEVLAELRGLLPQPGDFAGIAYDELSARLGGADKAALPNTVAALVKAGAILRRKREAGEKSYGSTYVYAVAPGAEPELAAEPSGESGESWAADPAPAVWDGGADEAVAGGAEGADACPEDSSLPF